MPMRQLRKSSVGPTNSSAVAVKLRKVVPVIPSTEPERTELMDDLTTMGCLGLLDKPWGFREERMVRELLDGRSNEFDNTLRGAHRLWTEELWRAVYGFRSGGAGMANRKDEFIRGKFQGAVNPKDGYAVGDCIDERQRHLLEFLVPVLHPEKPTRVTITLGNTIFGALSGARKVDWGRIISDLVGQLASRVGGSRATPICPYVYHLYHHHQLLTSTEEKEWKTQEVILKYGESGSSDEEENDSGTESDPETEEEEEPVVPLAKRQKVTPPHGRGTPPGRGKAEPESKPDKGKAVADGPDPKDPFEDMIAILSRVRADWEIKRRVVNTIGELVGAPPDSKLPSKVADCITNPVDFRKKEEEVQVRDEEIRHLREENEALRAEVAALKDNATATREIAEVTRQVAEQVRATLGEAGMAASKARLYDLEYNKEKKPSGTRMVRILTDFAEQVESTLVEARKAADRIEVSSRKLTEVTASREFHLSDLSFPDLSAGPSAPKDGKDRTPESKKAARKPTQTPASAIDLDSPPGSAREIPNPASASGERSRNLGNLIQKLESKSQEIIPDPMAED